MDWKSVAEKLASIGLPAIGMAVGGPAGALVAKGLVSALGLDANSTPDQVAAAVANATPDQLVALKALDAQMAKDQLDADTALTDSVNKTLQTEAMGGSFWQRNHHAYESSAAILLVIFLYVVLPLAKIPVPSVPTEAFIMIGAVLGVTAWQRGAANVATARGQ